MAVQRSNRHLAFGLLFAALCLPQWPAKAADADAGGHAPLLWKVAGEQGDLYLLGSVHMLSKEDYPLPQAMHAAYAEAEELVFELSPEAMR